MKVDPGKAKWLPIDNEVFRVLTAMPDDGPLGRVLRKLACPLYGRKDVYELDAFEQEYYERACSTLNERLEKLGNSISNLPQNNRGKKGPEKRTSPVQKPIENVFIDRDGNRISIEYKPKSR